MPKPTKREWKIACYAAASKGGNPEDYFTDGVLNIDTYPTNKRQINRAIKHLGLEVLTPEQFNNFIAEELQLPKVTRCPVCRGTGDTGTEQDHRPCHTCNQTGVVEPHVEFIPNYYEDLRACATFEENAPPVYWLYLGQVTGAVAQAADWRVYRAIGSATPQQRCRAFQLACWYLGESNKWPVEAKS